MMNTTPDEMGEGTRAIVSLNLRLKDLLGPVTRVKKKKKDTGQRRGEMQGRGPHGRRGEGPCIADLIAKHL